MFLYIRPSSYGADVGKDCFMSHCELWRVGTLYNPNFSESECISCHGRTLRKNLSLKTIDTYNGNTKMSYTIARKSM